MTELTKNEKLAPIIDCSWIEATPIVMEELKLALGDKLRSEFNAIPLALKLQNLTEANGHYIADAFTKTASLLLNLDGNMDSKLATLYVPMDENNGLMLLGTKNMNESATLSLLDKTQQTLTFMSTSLVDHTK